MTPHVRPAAVAGAFYPGDPRELAAEIEELLDGVERFEPRFAHPKALIVPHAGYIYSGPVAAAAFDELAPARGVVKRVVLLGPVHRVAVRGLALPSSDTFETPLGKVPVDGDAARSLAGLKQVVRSEPAHAQEHSLEVQLPFLQKVLGEFSLVPLAVGTAATEEVAQVIERLWGGPETLIVVSTDLSHYHEYDEARRIDRATVTRIASFATDLDHEEACGATPLNGLLAAARAKGLAIRLLAACNSGDTAGGKGRVVGYSAFALHEGEPVSRE
ncbi:MAG: AmmeMemoRadiSam system protein B, partial [Burkholderiales bacterium]